VKLLSLTLQDFRNLEKVELRQVPRATIAVGQNGQGKTNLLEAIYFLATLKPLRAGRLAELVRFGRERAQVTGRFELKGAERQISVEVAQGVKAAFVDGKRAPSLEDYFGGVSVVAFTPDDLATVKGGPDDRRRLLDRAVFNRYPAYLEESRAFARALKGRNRLLRDNAEPAYLDVYDETLCRVAARIWSRRQALVAEVAPRAVRAFESIGRTEGSVSFEYRVAHLRLNLSTATETETAAALREALSARLARDHDRGFTSVGPHADDLDVRLSERPARAFASQGQQRALVLAWKVAEIENLRAALGYLPLLLLDDVSSELDPERNAYLMEYLAKSGAQVFLTTTDASLVRRAAGDDASWLTVKAGVVS
jgi:DNA replication and repair protein RecF